MKKFKKNGGFTMVELLIVVAIIAILVAVSIPMFLDALEESRHGVDKATYRDAVGLANSYYLTHVTDFTAEGDNAELEYLVSAQNSGMIADWTAPSYPEGYDKVAPVCTCGYSDEIEEYPDYFYVKVTYHAPTSGTEATIDIETNWDPYMKALNAKA